MRTWSYRHLPGECQDEWAIEFKPQHGPSGFIGGAVSEAWARTIVDALNAAEAWRVGLRAAEADAIQRIERNAGRLAPSTCVRCLQTAPLFCAHCTLSLARTPSEG